MQVIISKGFKKPTVVATLFAGSSYGELALINPKARRNATIRSISDVYV